MTIPRRSFISTLLTAIPALGTAPIQSLNPERISWRPGQRRFFDLYIPSRTITLAPFPALPTPATFADYVMRHEWSSTDINLRSQFERDLITHILTHTPLTIRVGRLETIVLPPFTITEN